MFKRKYYLKKDGYIYTKIDKQRKISAQIFLQALGLSQKKIFLSIKNTYSLVEIKSKNIPKNAKEALINWKETITDKSANILSNKIN